MYHHVTLQLCTLDAAIGAVIAAMRLLSSVSADVSVEVRLLTKGLGKKGTLIWFTASMDMNVVPHVIFSYRRVFTIGTVVLPGGAVTPDQTTVVILHQLLKRTESHGHTRSAEMHYPTNP